MYNSYVKQAKLTLNKCVAIAFLSNVYSCMLYVIIVTYGKGSIQQCTCTCICRFHIYTCTCTWLTLPSNQSFYRLIVGFGMGVADCEVGQ